MPRHERSYTPPQREVATHEKDRPHQYNPTAGAWGAICRICMAGAHDERHSRYEELALQQQRAALVDSSQASHRIFG